MKKTLIHLGIGTIWLLPTFTLAQSIGLQNPINVNSISDLILIVTRVVRYIAIPFIVIAIMYSGFQYIAAAANVSGYKIEKAHESIRWTIIGAFVLLSSELIALVMKNTIQSLTGN